ncbi:uncharacterized protein [Nicotiana sylvestris]|uniref:uncharacterized protein n=1 Tax=Nicotiana sylvestris TaxID=4096 RepID=UPI00388C6CCC
MICEPIFQMLKKDAATRWTEECQKAFDRIKEYVSTPPVLVPPKPGRTLLLYLSVLDGSFGCVLGQHDEMRRKKQSIYYLNGSPKIHLSETNAYRETSKLADIVEYITKSKDGWIMFFDVVANFKGVGIGTILVSETGQHYPISAKPRSSGTQVLREWATNNTKILLYMYHVQELMKRFTEIEFKHVLRIQNEFADALATLSSMIQHPGKNFIDPIPVRIHNQLAYCAHVEEETDENPWFHDIKEYLAKGPGACKSYSEMHAPEIVQSFLPKRRNFV